MTFALRTFAMLLSVARSNSQKCHTKLITHDAARRQIDGFWRRFLHGPGRIQLVVGRRLWSIASSGLLLPLAFLAGSGNVYGQATERIAADVPSPGPVLPSQEFGVLVMAHGGPDEWNKAVGAAMHPLASRYPLEVAFGMADAATIQSAVGRLEERGVREIGVVRLFVSGKSWYERTEQILGLKEGAPPKSDETECGSHASGVHHGPDHSMEFWRIQTRSRFVLSTEGLAEASATETILRNRVEALSREPRIEDVLILAHGPGDDVENEEWIATIDARADAIRAALPFRRVRTMTLREDWPEKRELAETEIRAYVRGASAEGGRALVVPFRVHGFGPYAAVLEGLDYVADGCGLLPHPLITEWIENQIARLRGGPFRGTLPDSSSVPAMPSPVERP